MNKNSGTISRNQEPLVLYFVILGIPGNDLLNTNPEVRRNMTNMTRDCERVYVCVIVSELDIGEVRHVRAGRGGLCLSVIDRT